MPIDRSSVTIGDQPLDDNEKAADAVVSPDALALVRFGLRAADDPRILNTIKVIDGTLKVETPYGPAWHRYNGDAYGEYEDGSPYDGSGIGRAWPLLTGERAHYELAAGHPDVALSLMKTLEAFAGDGGMLPEQIWDSEAIPERNLYCGRPSGSAMPLVWAHAEHIKLRRSLREGHIFDMPPYTVQRYLIDDTHSPYFLWRFNHQSKRLTQGKRLRVEVNAPAVIQWSADDWATIHDTPTQPSGLGNHYADLPTNSLAVGTAFVFTFYWSEVDHWEHQNFTVTVI